MDSFISILIVYEMIACVFFGFQLTALLLLVFLIVKMPKFIASLSGRKR